MSQTKQIIRLHLQKYAIKAISAPPIDALQITDEITEPVLLTVITFVPALRGIFAFPDQHGKLVVGDFPDPAVALPFVRIVVGFHEIDKVVTLESIKLVRIHSVQGVQVVSVVMALPPCEWPAAVVGMLPFPETGRGLKYLSWDWELL